MKVIMMCLTIDELNIISDGLDLLKNEFGTNIEVGEIDIQYVIDRVNNAIDKIEND